MSSFNNSEWSASNLDPDTFVPTGLDIDQWLDACVSAGMTYAMLTVKHHDGFALWPTAYAVPTFDPYSIAQTAWYAANGNPDVVGLFVTKCREHGLNPCLYFSIWDGTFEARTGTDEQSNPAGYLAMIQAQLTELLTNYGDITAIWFDGWGWHLGYEEIAYHTIHFFVKNLQPNCVVIDNLQLHPNVTSEIETYETPADSSFWTGNTRLSEEVTTIRVNTHWFYNTNDGQADGDYKSAASLLAERALANANNGTLLLGLTPNKAGVLPAAQVTRLGQLGA